MKRVILILIAFFFTITTNAQKKVSLDSLNDKQLISLASAYKYGINRNVDVEKSIVILKKLARRHNPIGMRELGKMYLVGDGVKQSKKRALILFNNASLQNDCDAMCRLAQMYQEGNGVRQNYATAFALYRRAARRDYAKGYYGAGYILYKGLGVSQSYSEAARYLKIAAEKGHPASCFLLGLCYANGFLGNADYESAKNFFYAAAKNGNGWTVDLIKYNVLDSIMSRNEYVSKKWNDIINIFKNLEANNLQEGDSIACDSIVGEWNGQNYIFDWGRNKILKASNIQIQLCNSNAGLNIKWIENDSILSTTILDKRQGNLWYRDKLSKEERSEYKWIVTSFEVDSMSKDKIYVRMTSHTSRNKEVRKPMFAELSRFKHVENEEPSVLEIKSILPMPVIGDKFVVAVESGKQCLARAAIYNLYGVKVADCGEFSLQKGLSSITIRSTQPKGNYILSFTVEGKQISKKIIYL